MNKASIAQIKAKRKTSKQNNNMLLVTHPELRELIIDLAEFTSKHKPSEIARVVGLRKQNLNYYLKKRKESK